MVDRTSTCLVPSFWLVYSDPCEGSTCRFPPVCRGISGLLFHSPFLSPLFLLFLPSPLALSVVSFLC